MRRSAAYTVLVLFLMLLAVAVESPTRGQSIQTEGNIETDAQLVSNVARGTAPLAVSSTSHVPNLNADLLDGESSEFFAFFSEFLANQAAIAAHNPDPPCFNNTHRFVDCGNGTVTDTETGVIWLEDASCFAAQDYATANATAAALFDGSTTDPSGGDCGLEDGSRLGDWRLPTRQEWLEIGKGNCPNDPEIVGNGSPIHGCFTDAPWATDVEASGLYWSPSGDNNESAKAARMLMSGGSVGPDSKSTNAFVWPVRGGTPSVDAP